MRAFTTLLAFGVAAVTAQSSSVSSAAVASASAQSSVNASSTTGGPMTHTVSVGKAGNTFSPDVLQVPVGDIIEFDFYPTNHSVARAAYGYPCVPYELVLGAGYYGFWSGFEPVDAILANPPKYSIRVNDSQPILYYCGSPGSCTGYGMVGIINPNSSTSLAHQKQLALESTYTLVPGESWPSEDSIPSGAAGSPSASSTSTAPTAASTTTAAAVAAKSSGIGPGAIAGIAIGAAAVLLAGAVAIWFCGRQSRRPKTPPAAPAQEIVGMHGQGSYPTYNKHMSTVSGHAMPPNYDPRVSGMTYATPVDPMMEQRMSMLGSPMQSPGPMPVYSNNQLPNMYAVGTHHVSPVEVPGHPIGSPSIGSPSIGSPPRRSIDKPGVERYQ